MDLHIFQTMRQGLVAAWRQKFPAIDQRRQNGDDKRLPNFNQTNV
jgi:hypothetical protein